MIEKVELFTLDGSRHERIIEIDNADFLSKRFLKSLIDFGMDEDEIDEVFEEKEEHFQEIADTFFDADFDEVLEWNQEEDICAFVSKFEDYIGKTF